MGREAKIVGRLTIKQYTFVTGISKGMSATQAAMNAYNVKNSHVARVIASENLSKPYIREEINKVLRTNGVSLEIVAQNFLTIANAIPLKISGEVSLKASIELAKILRMYPDYV